MPAATRTAAIIGVGNTLRGDDGVGIHAALRLQGQTHGVEVFDAGTAPFDLLGVFLEHDTVIVIDCICTGREPGTMYRLPPEAMDTAEESVRFAHGMGVPSTVRLARELGSTAEIVVYGLEPAMIGWSLGLSPEVAAALPALLEAVIDELKAVRSG